MGGWELFFTGLGNVLEPFNFTMMATGLVIGVLAGALPGITMMNAIVLVLPFTYIMGIVPSLLLMSGIYCGGVFGGSITGILFNIPGEPSSVATTFDGHPMAKAGRATEALTTAFLSSGFGALFGQELAQVVGVVAPVGEEPADRSSGADQVCGHADIVDVPGAEQEHARPAKLVVVKATYGVPGDARDHLSRSMKVWRQLHSMSPAPK